jgi:hypothetical protein
MFLISRVVITKFIIIGVLKDGAKLYVDINNTFIKIGCRMCTPENAFNFISSRYDLTKVNNLNIDHQCKIRVVAVIKNGSITESAIDEPAYLKTKRELERAAGVHRLTLKAKYGEQLGDFLDEHIPPPTKRRPSLATQVKVSKKARMP